MMVHMQSVMFQMLMMMQRVTLVNMQMNDNVDDDIPVGTERQKRQRPEAWTPGGGVPVGASSVSCRRRRLHVVVSGEQITMRSTWVFNRGELTPQTKVTLYLHEMETHGSLS